MTARIATAAAWLAAMAATGIYLWAAYKSGIQATP